MLVPPALEDGRSCPSTLRRKPKAPVSCRLGAPSGLPVSRIVKDRYGTAARDGIGTATTTHGGQARQH